MTQDFFSNLQNHSNTKIQILNNYYIPWLRKITLGQFNIGRCLVIDGFAGRGIYEDGSIGSPLVLIKGAIDFYEQCSQNSWSPPEITIILVEGLKANYDALIENISKHFNINYENDSHSSFVLTNYPTIRIVPYCDTFENVFKEYLGKIPKGKTLIPSFCFVDPFGFSHTPFELFEKYLLNEKSELLFNFMFEEINRFIMSDKNSKLIETYERLFGISDIKELRDEIGNETGKTRKKIVIDYYSRKLRVNTAAQHVLNFEFKKNGRTKMFLIYATKNKHGLALMKDVMWKLDGTGMFLFDDRLQADQIEFSFLSEMLKDDMQKKLSVIINEEFKGRKNVSMEELETYVLEKTIYPTNGYFKNALKILEKAQLIQVNRPAGVRRFTFAQVNHINF